MGHFSMNSLRAHVLLILLLGIMLPSNWALLAEVLPCPLSEEELPKQSLIISAMEFEGLVKTEKNHLLRFFETAVAENLVPEKLSDDLARVQDLGIFSQISCTMVVQGYHASLHITFQEKWTLIPIMKFASGGGVRQQTLGILDANVLGQARELGAFAEKLGRSVSGVLWYRETAGFDPRWSLFVQGWSIHRLRTKYFQEIDEVRVKTGFFQSRQKYQLDLGYEWTSRWKSTLIFEYNEDNFSDQFQSTEVKDRLQVTGLPPSTQAGIMGLSNRWGRVTAHGSQFLGHEWEHSVRVYSISGSDVRDFLQNDFRWRGFFSLSTQTTLAYQVRAGISDTTVLQYWYYLGGLDGIRGFKDNRFAGRNFWLTNFEVRQNFVLSPTVHLQILPFFDSVAVSENIRSLNAVDGQSLGLGARVILPNVYRLVLRVDYAWPLKRHDDEQLGFGVQHFF